MKTIVRIDFQTKIGGKFSHNLIYPTLLRETLWFFKASEDEDKIAFFSSENVKNKKSALK